MPTNPTWEDVEDVPSWGDTEDVPNWSDTVDRESPPIILPPETGTFRQPSLGEVALEQQAQPFTPIVRPPPDFNTLMGGTVDQRKLVAPTFEQAVPGAGELQAVPEPTESLKPATFLQRLNLSPIGRTVSPPQTQLEAMGEIGPKRLVIDPDESPIRAAGKEAVNLFLGLGEFATSPTGIATVGAAAIAPEVVAAGFTVQLLDALGEQAMSTYENWSKMTPAQKTVAITDMAGTGAFAALSAKGMMGKKATLPEQSKIAKEVVPTPFEAELWHGGRFSEPSLEMAREGDIAAAYYTPSKKIAEYHAKESGGDIFKTKISLKNPASEGVVSKVENELLSKTEDGEPIYRIGDGKRVAARLIEMGYDGAIRMGGDEILVFNKPAKVANRAEMKLSSVRAPEASEILFPTDDLNFRGQVPVKAGEVTRIQKVKNDAGETVYAITYGPNGEFIGYTKNDAWEYHPKFEKPTVETAPKPEVVPTEQKTQSPQQIADQIGMRFDGENAGKWDFTLFDNAGKESTTITVKAGASPDTIVNHYELKRAEYQGAEGSPRPPAKGLTAMAYELGKQIKTEDIPRLEAERAQINSDYVKSLESGGQFDPQLAMRGQYLNEAIKYRKAVEEAKALKNPTPEQLAEIERRLGVSAKGNYDGALLREALGESKGVGAEFEVLRSAKEKGTITPEQQMRYDELLTKVDQGKAQKDAWQKQMQDRLKQEAAPTPAEPTVESVTPLHPESGTPISATDALIAKLDFLKSPTEPVKPVTPKPEPELVGMGAAKVGEVQPAPTTATSIKNAAVDKERASRGLPPAIEPVRRSFGRVWDEAMAKIDRDPQSQDMLINELREKPRALTDLEDATILHRQIDLQNEYGKATRELAQAFDDGRTEDVIDAKARVAILSDQLLDLYNIGKKVGTETGRGLNARKMMAYEDFSLAKMELEKRAAKGGRRLTDAEQAEVVRLNQQIERTQKAHDDYVGKKDARDAETELNQSLDEIKKTASKPTTPKTAKDITDAAAETEKVKVGIKAKIDSGERSDISSFVQRLARLFVEQGVVERNALIDSVHGVLREIDPQFSRRETMDAISGYGDFRQLTKDEISLKLRDLKGQMQQVAKLEDMQAGQPPMKTGVERRIPSTEESRLIRLVNEAKNQFQIPITDPGTQLKSSLDTLKSRLANETAKWEDKLARKDFSKKPKRIIQMDAEANRLHFENAEAKARWHEALMKDRLANRSIPRKVMAGLGEVLNTFRAIMTSFDFSAVLRQGGFIAFAHPMRASKSLVPMFKAFASAENQHMVNREIMARKNYPLYMQSKLFLSEHGQKLSQMEEAYMARWAEKIPGVGASQRAYTTFLNKLRADSFDAMSRTLARTGELTPTEAGAIANFVNVSTGRGSMGMRENALVGLNTIFFAPRYVASRFQLLAGQPMYRGSARTRTAIAEEYARFLIGVGAVYAIANTSDGTIETDPRSADFGKVKFGNTRLDPMAGLLQSTVLLSRITTGETKTSKGNIVPIRGEKVPYGSGNAADVMARFLRSKLSPVIGTGVNIAAGKDVVGQPVTPESTAKSLLVPLSLQDIYKAMLEQGVPEGTALGILSIFGMGLQNYNSQKPINQ